MNIKIWMLGRLVIEHKRLTALADGFCDSGKGRIFWLKASMMGGSGT
jgi:hypothetical protein